MTVATDPEAILSPLPRSDGSASYSYGGYAVTAAVNGPIEAQRRDEDPYQSLVDVVVRPGAGVGGSGHSYHVKYRQLSSPFVSRNQRAPSGSNYPGIPQTTSFSQEFPPLSYPSGATDHIVARERLCQCKTCPGQLGRQFEL